MAVTVLQQLTALSGKTFDVVKLVLQRLHVFLHYVDVLEGEVMAGGGDRTITIERFDRQTIQ
jgi:hypothetical protein